MKIASLRIKNLYSFEDENINFNDFNLIVGPNGGGKTNIIRSLKTIINKPHLPPTLPIGHQAKLESLLSSVISPDIKLFKEKKSAIKIECQLSKEELKLLFEFIFKQDIEIEKVQNYNNNAVFTLLIAWPVEYSNDINPDLLIFRFPNGFTFLHISSSQQTDYTIYMEDQKTLDSFFIEDILSSKIWEDVKKEKFCNENNFTGSNEDSKAQNVKQLLVFNEVYNDKNLILPLQHNESPNMAKLVTSSEDDKPIDGETYFEYRNKIKDLLPENENFLSSMLENKDNIERILAVSYFEQKYNNGATQIIFRESGPETKVFSQPLTSYESYQNDEPIEVKSLLLYSDKLADFRFPYRYDKQYFSDIKGVFFDMGSKIDLSSWGPDIWLFLSNLIFQKIILFKEVPDDENALTEKLFNLKTEDGFEKNYSDMKVVFKKIFGNGLDFDVVTSEDNKTIKIKDNNKSFKLKDSASGYFDVLSLFTEISNKADSIIILDEPLTRLHHSKQGLVGNVLFKNQNQNQIIMVTHSPSFVNYEVIKNNNLIYVRRDEDNSRVYRRDSHDEIPKSHLLNRDIFFSNFVLAVEGPTDEAVFKAISDRKNDLFWQNDILILNMQGKDMVKKFGKFMHQYGINFIILVDHDYCIKSNDIKCIKTKKIETGKFYVYPFESDKNQSNMTNLIYIMSDKDKNMDNVIKNLGYDYEGKGKDIGNYYDFFYNNFKKDESFRSETLLFNIIIKKIEELLRLRKRKAIHKK